MEIKEREKDSQGFLDNIPALMEGIFEHLSKLLQEAESEFKGKIASIV